MRRREFIRLLGGAATWPVAARAQQPAKLPTIGFLGANNATFERASADAFVQRLRELGWIENRTVAIEYRWAEGRDERFAEIAAEFIRLKVDVILTYATPSSTAAKKAQFLPFLSSSSLSSLSSSSSSSSSSFSSLGSRGGASCCP